MVQLNDDAFRFYEYVVQIVLITGVVIVSLVNLTFDFGNCDLWKYLLLTLLGYVLPNPSIRHRRISGRRPSDAMDHVSSTT